MSHFTVLVARPEGQSLEEMLEPYQEGGGIVEEFSNETREVMERYEEHKDEYDNPTHFAKEYFGYEVLNGEFGYFYNPQAKWDWWVEGGRFGGLPIKGNLPVLSESPQSPPIHTARKSEVDFSLDEEQYERSIHFWELIVEGLEPQSQADEDIISWNLYKAEYYIENYQDKETYAKAQATFNAYAFVDQNGEWHSQGDMGWFGLSEEDVDEALDYQLNFYEKFIEDLDDDIILTLVDCHI